MRWIKSEDDFCYSGKVGPLELKVYGAEGDWTVNVVHDPNRRCGKPYNEFCRYRARIEKLEDAKRICIEFANELLAASMYEIANAIAELGASET